MDQSDFSKRLERSMERWTYEELFREYDSMVQLCAVYIKNNHEKEVANGGLETVIQRQAEENNALQQENASLRAALDQQALNKGD